MIRLVRQTRELSRRRAEAQRWHFDPRRFDDPEVREKWLVAWKYFNGYFWQCTLRAQRLHYFWHGDPDQQPWPATRAEFREAYPHQG